MIESSAWNCSIAGEARPSPSFFAAWTTRNARTPLSGVPCDETDAHEHARPAGAAAVHLQLEPHGEVS